MSTSSRSKTTFPKPRKLRASCDGCNEAKVRCSQTKPTCARCLKNGVHCVYGISQRVGKQSASAYAAKQRAQAQESGILTPAESPPAVAAAPPPKSSGAVSPRHGRMSSSASSSTYQEDDMSEQMQRELFQRWTFDGRSSYSSTSPGTEISSLDLQDTSLLDHESLQMWRQTSMDGLITPLETDMLIDSHPFMPDAMTNQFLAGAGDPFAAPVNADFPMTTSGSSPPPPSLGNNPSDPSAAAAAAAAGTVPGLPRTRPSGKSAGECRCTESIITKLASLPVLLRTEDCAFDIKLVQFQEAIKVSNAALSCKCSCKDYSSMLALSLLISRLLSVVQFAWGASPAVRDRQNGPSSDIMCDLSPMTPDAPPLPPPAAAAAAAAAATTAAMAAAVAAVPPHHPTAYHEHAPVNSHHHHINHHHHQQQLHQQHVQMQTLHRQAPPTFSLGIFQIDKEDEVSLKREVWLLQLRKVKNLVTSFRSLVSEAKWGQEKSQAELLEQLVFTLEDRARKVDEAWNAANVAMTL